MRDNFGLGLRCSRAVGHTALTTSNTLGCLENGQNVFCLLMPQSVRVVLVAFSSFSQGGIFQCNANSVPVEKVWGQRRKRSKYCSFVSFS